MYTKETVELLAKKASESNLALGKTYKTIAKVLFALSIGSVIIFYNLLAFVWAFFGILIGGAFYILGANAIKIGKFTSTDSPEYKEIMKAQFGDDSTPAPK